MTKNAGRTTRKRYTKAHPLPWAHETDGKWMSAVVDANGHAVCGSLISPTAQRVRDQQTHAMIVDCVNQVMTCKACKGTGVRFVKAGFTGERKATCSECRGTGHR